MSSGQLEPTLLKSFIRGGRLRRLLARSDCPPAIKECAVLFNRTYPKRDHIEPDVHGDQVTVDSSSVEDGVSQVPPGLRQVIPWNKVTLHARFQHKGVSYTRCSTHLGNSLVLFYS